MKECAIHENSTSACDKSLVYDKMYNLQQPMLELRYNEEGCNDIWTLTISYWICVLEHFQAIFDFPLVLDLDLNQP